MRLSKRLAVLALLALGGCGGAPGDLDGQARLVRVADASVQPQDDSGVVGADGGVTDGGTDGGTTDAGSDAGSTGPGVELNPGWVGGACTSTNSCSSASFTQSPTCELASSGFPNGMCTQSCTLGGSGSYVCPDAASTGAGTLNTLTRCIDANGSPKCVAECDFAQSPTGCRPGYSCVQRQRFNQPSKIFSVCLPSTLLRWPGEGAQVNDMGGPCTGPQDCSYNSCLSMNGGYCSKGYCEFSGCPAGSSCFEIGTTGQTACLKDCTSNLQCRTGEGYECNSSYDICFPGSSGSPWNSSVGAADCAAVWGSAGSGLSSCDLTKDDYVVVRKSARNVALCNQGGVVANFQGGLGFSPVGDKVQEGDGKTPEGVFYVAGTLPNSQYYKAFLLSYPDKGDATRGLNAGLISSAEKTAIDNAQNACTTPPQTTALGGYIELHGMGGSSDWTWGCVAVENSQIDQLWATLGVGDTIAVLP